jgi:hypothetical protein
LQSPGQWYANITRSGNRRLRLKSLQACCKAGPRANRSDERRQRSLQIPGLPHSRHWHWQRNATRARRLNGGRSAATHRPRARTCGERTQTRSAPQCSTRTRVATQSTQASAGSRRAGASASAKSRTCRAAKTQAYGSGERCRRASVAFASQTHIR